MSPQLDARVTAIAIMGRSSSRWWAYCGYLPRSRSIVPAGAAAPVSMRRARPPRRSQARPVQSSSQRSTRTLTSGLASMSRTRASSRGSSVRFGLSSSGEYSVSCSGSTTKQIGTSRGRPVSSRVARIARRASPRNRRRAAVRTVDAIRGQSWSTDGRTRLSVVPDQMAPPTRHISTRSIVAVRGNALEVRTDRVVGEAPLEIRAAGPGQEPVAVAVTMRTPGFEDELAVGFLRTEGLIEGPEFVSATPGDPRVLNQPDDTIVVRLSRPFDDSAVAERHFVATASCGICGKASIDEIAVRCAPLPEGPVVPRTVILALPDLLRAAQRAFDETGGLHAAALFSPTGELLAIREDVGRHNALDKLIGSRLLAGELPLHDRILMVSGRVSFEIVQKAAVAGVPIICAVSAPSDLAVETADRLGVTLIGFLRGDGFNVYTHDGRVELRDLTGWG